MGITGTPSKHSIGETSYMAAERNQPIIDMTHAPRRYWGCNTQSHMRSWEREAPKLSLGSCRRGRCSGEPEGRLWKSGELVGVVWSWGRVLGRLILYKSPKVNQNAN